MPIILTNASIEALLAEAYDLIETVSESDGSSYPTEAEEAMLLDSVTDVHRRVENVLSALADTSDTVLRRDLTECWADLRSILRSL